MERLLKLVAVSDLYSSSMSCGAEPQQESGGRQPTLVLRAMGAQERLWDLAKAYRTTVAEILTANELSAEADAPGGEMLLIPCRR